MIVVDNHSSDRSVERARAEHPEVTIVENGCNRGFAAACNQGISRSTGELVLLLNDDASIAPGALDQLARAFSGEARAGAIGAQLRDGNGSPLASARAVPTFLDELGLAWGRQPPEPTSGGEVVEVESVPGACLAVRRAAIEDAGALDEDFFFYFEDIEWCRRLRRRGWKVLLHRGAAATHLQAVSSRAVPRVAQLELLRSRIIYYRKTFAPPLAAALELHRSLRLAVNALAQLAGLVLTLGRSERQRRKLGDYAFLLRWLAAGKPRDWGFPDKCPDTGDPS
ncbi:MAG: hypothetical protein QOD06_1770 [Candidatus Binatota bacterium]|nr:hypothetical protein [Candidatus Binatota bacterium]